MPNHFNSEPHGLADISGIIRWLLSRQVGYEAGEEHDDVEYPYITDRPRGITHGVAISDRRKDSEETMPDIIGLSPEEHQFVGFNGRCNKPVDTCYAFWVTASLDVRSYMN